MIDDKKVIVQVTKHDKRGKVIEKEIIRFRYLDRAVRACQFINSKARVHAEIIRWKGAGNEI